MVVGSNRWPLVAVSGGHRDSSYKGYSFHPHSTKPTFIHPFNPPPPSVGWTGGQSGGVEEEE